MGLQIGSTAPDFEADTSQGKISFHDWIGDSWAVLFSHPKDFTPVCTTELGYMARLGPEFDKRGVKVIGLSVDSTTDHEAWADDIEETQGARPNYPIIGDADTRSTPVTRAWAGFGPRIAAVEPKPIMRAVLRGGLGNKMALRTDYLDELLSVGRRPGYPTVARAVYGNLPSLIAARSRYTDVTAPVHLVYGEKDWSRRSDREANRQLLPDAEFVEIPAAGHFIALERPDVPADLLSSRA